MDACLLVLKGANQRVHLHVREPPSQQHVQTVLVVVAVDVQEVAVEAVAVGAQAVVLEAVPAHQRLRAVRARLRANNIVAIHAIIHVPAIVILHADVHAMEPVKQLVHTLAMDRLHALHV
jgi:hypothetical protein